MKNWPGQFWLHLIGCFIFLALPFLFSPDGPESIRDFMQRPPQIRELIHYLLLMVFFYLNYCWFVPKYYFSKQYLFYGLIIVACLFAIAYLPNMIISEKAAIQPPPDAGSDFGMRRGSRPGMNGFWSRVNHNIFLFFALFFFSLLLRIGLKWRQTERERMSSELSYLRAQINPHFLFNTLNSIYSLAIQKSDNTAAAIVKLSGMMRYITTEAEKEKVLLEKELNYINDYIDLQMLRFGEEARVIYTANIDPGSKKIAPLILIGFIENAFKYGVNAEEEASIEIKLELIGDQLKMFVRNRKVVQKKMAEEGTGIGIQNTSNRLRLLYPGKHQLEVFDNPDDFIVSLTLQLS
jgi:two-component sensor histidine kinase